MLIELTKEKLFMLFFLILSVMVTSSLVKALDEKHLSTPPRVAQAGQKEQIFNTPEKKTRLYD